MTVGSASTGTALERPPASATLAQVAQAAGVSIATASRVLNNSSRVSAEAYQRVCEAATRLGYRRHRAAWGRSGGGLRAVTAVVHAGHRMLFTEPFFARFLVTAEGELAAHDIPLLVTSVTGTLAGTLARYLRGGHTDGVIILSDHGPLPLSSALATQGLPVVAVGRPPHPCPVPYVDADNRGGARRAVEYLFTRGRCSIGHIAGPPDTTVGADRLAGYRDALRAAGVTDAPIAYGDWSRPSAAHAMQRLLDQRPGLDAVFAASDVMAAGAMRCLARAGRRVPDDVAVIGFDDHPLAAQLRPPLTTVRQPVEEFAAAAVRLVLASRSEGAGGREPQDARPAILPTQLVVRNST